MCVRVKWEKRRLWEGTLMQLCEGGVPFRVIITTCLAATDACVLSAPTNGSGGSRSPEYPQVSRYWSHPFGLRPASVMA